MRPAIGVADGRIQLLVRQIEPGQPLVVEVSQRALLAFSVAVVRPLRSTPPRFVQKAARCDHRNAPK